MSPGTFTAATASLRAIVGSLPVVTLLTLVLSAQPVLAACTQGGVYGPNQGAVRIGGTTNADGVRATVDLIAVNLNSGTGVAHPMQWGALSPSTDFLGFGTYNGWAPPTGNCPTDFHGWNIYADGLVMDVYFCVQLGQLAIDATGNRFKIKWGDACASTKAGFYINNSILYCRTVTRAPGQWAAGGEALRENPIGTWPKLPVTVRYYDVDKRSYSGGNWTSVTGGTSVCEPTNYYDIEVTVPDNFRIRTL